MPRTFTLLAIVAAVAGLAVPATAPGAGADQIKLISPTTVALPTELQVTTPKQNAYVVGAASQYFGTAQSARRRGPDEAGEYLHFVPLAHTPVGVLRVRVNTYDPGESTPLTSDFEITVTGGDNLADFRDFANSVRPTRGRGIYEIQSTLQLVAVRAVRVRHDIRLERKREGNRWTLVGKADNAEAFPGSYFPETVYTRLDLRSKRRAIVTQLNRGGRFRIVVNREVRDRSGRLVNPPGFPPRLIRPFSLR